MPIVNILAVAPAGCGKTEALALRAGGLIDRRIIMSPQMILALTFTNKAKDNLSARMKQVIGPRWRERVTVTNFHGVAARLIRAHGRVVGLASDLLLPNETWRRRKLRELRLGRESDLFETALREAKNGPYDDDEVMSRLAASGIDLAVTFEEHLRAERRLDYDDLIRHSSRLMAVDDVTRLYREHFGAVMVDEVQDLTMAQYGIVRGLGGDRVTYAGDPAQAIYSFAGADPVNVFNEIHALNPEIVELAHSFRSAPAILGAVNVLAAELGSTRLLCADPAAWPDSGHVSVLESDDTRAEAISVVEMLKQLSSRDPSWTIGIVCRRGTRMAHLREAVDAAGLPYEDWGEPTQVPKVVNLFRRHLREARSVGESEAGLAELEKLCLASIDHSDVATRDEVMAACADLADVITGGESLSGAVGACKAKPSTDKPVSSGGHFLTGHRGKGQEFDWVIILGLEEGHIPDFRNADNPEELRVLHVMVSRARYGLIMTYSRNTMTSYGWRATNPSQWLGLLRAAVTLP